LIEHGLDINKEDNSVKTPFFDACCSGNKDLVEYLINLGSDIHKENKDGETVLFYTYHTRYKNIFEYLIEHK